jgi:hypothetical protein
MFTSARYSQDMSKQTNTKFLPVLDIPKIILDLACAVFALLSKYRSRTIPCGLEPKTGSPSVILRPYL